MKKFLFCLLFIASAGSASANNWKTDYLPDDSVKVVSLLKEAATQKKVGNKMLYFARQLTGVPYVAKTLERNKQEQLVVNLRQLDCTTYVETVLALTRCLEQNKLTFAAFCYNLRMIRYSGGIVSYPTRQHYFTYWILQNEKKGIVKDIQLPNPPFTAVQNVNTYYMTTHIELYPMLVQNKAWISQIKAMETGINGLKCHYIPKSSLTDSKLLRQTVHNGDIIAIITSLKGLDTSHIGIAVWHKDGLHMLNASSIHHKVVEEPMLLKTYMSKHPSQLGIRIARPQ